MIPEIRYNRFEGVGLPEKNGWMQQGEGPMALISTQDELRGLGEDIADAEADLRRAISDLGGSWEGGAAESASAQFVAAADWLGDSGDLTSQASRGVEEQATAAGDVRNKVPPPPSLDQSFGDRLQDGAASMVNAWTFGVFDVQTDAQEKVAAYRQADQEANRALYEYESATRARATSMPAMREPPTMVVNPAPVTDTTNVQSVDSSTYSVDRRAGQADPSYASYATTGDQVRRAPSLPPTTPGVDYPGVVPPRGPDPVRQVRPVPCPPVDTTTPSFHHQDPVSEVERQRQLEQQREQQRLEQLRREYEDGLRQRREAQRLPAWGLPPGGVGQGPGGTVGGVGSRGLAGAGTRGGIPGGVPGGGEPGGRVPGGVARPGVGAVADERVGGAAGTRAGTAAGAGAGRGVGAAAGAGMGAGAVGRGGKGEEDVEHSDKYARPTDEHFVDDEGGQKVAPPVIGELPHR
ncbi:PPE domain-containing protein [Goodfellowiella coeruleoviolacea]|uniref:PPE family protein n=1 Tax=Goodfellowiella coeruleoviolacea TaxID=334858 RepID=A0AAE3GIV0_9PSEU|nr:PPE domain-containing protein [Goodfellowiella coeruleoviolacea]MCP2168285.1 PPE family protein [Goodfellowiella coeruleoviolacea]